MDSSLRSMSIHSIDSHIGSIYAVRASAATLLSRVAATTAITIDLVRPSPELHSIVSTLTNVLLPRPFSPCSPTWPTTSTFTPSRTFLVRDSGLPRAFPGVLPILEVNCRSKSSNSTRNTVQSFESVCNSSSRSWTHN